MYRHQGYNYVGIPAFTDYAHMKAHYEEVAPIRGRTEEVRPIGRRRYDWYEIVKNQVALLKDGDPLGEFATVYACKLYRTNVVEWYPNNDIILRVPRWRGPTSMGMLTYAMAQHGSIVSASGKWYFRSKDNVDYLLPDGKDGELLIRKADDGFYRPLDVAQEYRYKAKRKELNRIRKEYAPFVDYARNMFLICDTLPKDYHAVENLCKELGVKSTNLTGHGWGSTVENRTAFINKVKEAINSNDLDLMYKLATYCGYSFSRYNYYNGYECNANAVVRGFTEVLKYQYATEVFEAVEVEKGKAFIDRNAKYI